MARKGRRLCESLGVPVLRTSVGVALRAQGVKGPRPGPWSWPAPLLLKRRIGMVCHPERRVSQGTCRLEVASLLRCRPERTRRISSPGHGSKWRAIPRVVLSAGDGPRPALTTFEASSTIICHPEPAGEGSRRSPLSHPARYRPTAHSRCHPERSRRISFPATWLRCHRPTQVSS